MTRMLKHARYPFCLVGVLLGIALTGADGLAAELPGADQLRSAIADLSAAFPDHYPDGDGYLDRLSRLERQAGSPNGDRGLDEVQADFNALRREALLANPLVAGQPILFVVRHQYQRDHHNTATMFQTGEINSQKFEGPGSIKMIDFAAGGRVTTLLEASEGVARDPDVSFDGRRVLFSMRNNIDDDYHLYEMAADGTGLEQLTYGSGISDIDPIYLPDGRIMFTSTREPKFCMCNRHIMGNLFVAEPDGSDVQQVGHSTLHEGHAVLAPDGRVLYDRWEYVDRNFGDAQGVWSVNPDGTNHAVYWGNNTNSPGAVLDTRVIPGTQQFIATFSSCHDRPWGALAIVDRRLGIDGRGPVVRTWPPEAIDLVEVGNYDTFKKVTPKYEDPYPLSAEYFLCSRTTGEDEPVELWLVDVFGNELLLHSEAPGCYDPMPLAARPTPPAIPSRTDLAAAEGSFYVADVYEGSGMEEIQRGSVKYLRVVESPEKRFWTQPGYNGGTGTQAPGMAWDDFNNKRILGTVPVESDGSSYFSVPADTFVYFQLLDERGMMVQSMRSGTIVRPGEKTGCVGCHESRRASLLPEKLPMAMLRPPRRLEPWHGPARNFNYLAEVQPVFDRHCVSCHDYGQEAAASVNLAADLGLIFNTAYVELRSKKLVNVPGAGPYYVLAPKSWGSHASRLVEVLISGHSDAEIDDQIEMSPEDFDRVVTWVDINAPYYPDYASAYGENEFGRSPLDAAELARLVELTSPKSGKAEKGVKRPRKKITVSLSFTRPELSPCLEFFTDRSDPGYLEALGIIRSGAAMLGERPRADMPGFQLVSENEILQEAKYQAQLAAEATARQKIAQHDRAAKSSPPER